MDISGSMPADSGNVHVLISTERLRELEAIESNISTLIANAILEHKKNNLRKLHEKDKSNPENVNLRVKRYVERHKVELNARRREKRRLKKLEKEERDTPPTVSPVPIEPIESKPVIVRFDNEPVVDPSRKVITVRVIRSNVQGPGLP